MTDQATERPHALLSPSSSERWRFCPASAKVAQLYPPTSSEFADEGTAAHELAGWCLTEGTDADSYLGRVIEVPSRDGTAPRKFTVDKDMAEHVQGYVDRSREWLDLTVGAEMFVEQAVPVGIVTGEEGATGTADVVVVMPRTLSTGEEIVDVVVRDLKYGRGVPVDATRNSQLALYAAATVELLAPLYPVSDESFIMLEIDQPRRNNQSEWHVKLGELKGFIDEIRVAAKKALATPLDGERVAGEHCKWCPARASCPTRDLWVRTATASVTSAEGFTAEPAPSGRDEELARLAENLAKVAGVRDWCAAIEEEAHKVLAAGEKLPGYKLVQGRQGNRAWTDEDGEAVAAKLVSIGLDESDLFEKRLISPAACERLLPKAERNKLDAFISRADGKPTVAPESDPRPALNTNTDETGFTAT